MVLRRVSIDGHTPYCHVVPTDVLEELGLVPSRG